MGSAAQERRLKAKAQPGMASVKDERHSEDAKLEQGGPEGLEPELLCQHLAPQSGVGLGSGGRSHRGLPRGLPPTVPGQLS